VLRYGPLPCSILCCRAASLELKFSGSDDASETGKRSRTSTPTCSRHSSTPRSRYSELTYSDPREVIERHAPDGRAILDARADHFAAIHVTNFDLRISEPTQTSAIRSVVLISLQQKPFCEQFCRYGSARRLPIAMRGRSLRPSAARYSTPEARRLSPT